MQARCSLELRSLLQFVLSKIHELSCTLFKSFKHSNKRSEKHGLLGANSLVNETPMVETGPQWGW
jgi:hypothetical protein